MQWEWYVLCWQECCLVAEKRQTNITNHIVNNNNFAGANVTIQNDAEDVEQLIKRATTFETLNEFDKAIKVANSTEQENIFKRKLEYEEAYKKEVDRHENGKYNASICNLYDYRDVERALGCKCLTSEYHTFSSFTFVLGNYVECCVSYMGVGFQNGEAKVERQYTYDKSTCEKNVDRTNIEEILSDCRKKSENKGGCYIATCVYGSYDCPQVWTLRRFRDYTLDETWYGRLFIKCYYAISLILVKWFGQTKWFRRFWRSKLDKMVANLNSKGIEDTHYKDKY